MTRVRIDVLLRDEIRDPQGAAVRDGLERLGVAAERVRVGKHLVVDLGDDAPEGDALAEAVERACSRLLANPVIERWEWRVEEG